MRLFPRGETVETREVRAGLGGHAAVGREHVDDRQLVAQADFKVRLVVRRRHLQHTGAEVERDVIVRDDRDAALLLWHFERQRAIDVLADEMRVARVVRVHGHGGVRGDRLRARGGDGQKSAGLLRDLDAEVIHEALLLLHEHLFVRERGERGGAPVHHAFAAVDEALLVEVHEHARHAARVVLVHREPRARPVARSAERAELLQNDAAVFFLPLPDFADERLAAEVVAMLHHAFLSQRFLHDILRRDARVVGARQPQHFVPRHARATGEDVLNRVVQHMPEREHAGDIRRRDDDGIRGLRRSRVGGEAAVLLPKGIPLRLNGGGLVGFRNLRHGACCLLGKKGAQGGAARRWWQAGRGAALDVGR